MDQETDFFSTVLKIGLGVFLGGLLLWAAAEYRTRYVLQQMNEAVEQSVAQMQATAKRQREQRALQFRRQEEMRAAAARNKRAEQISRANQQREVLAAERAKEEAWNRYFQPSAECLKTWSVECGNQQIRARRKFDQEYGR